MAALTRSGARKASEIVMLTLRTLVTAAIARNSRIRSLDLEIHRRCFSAVLFDLILDLLPFIERTQSSALDCGDVDEHVLAATALRLNESIALGRIEPLHRAARHYRSP